MNKEEKKAIKMLDKFTTEHKFYNIKHSDNLEDNIEIVLNLIEKIQKENEELHKEIYRMKSLDIYKLVEDLKTGQLIPIKKIKDKIKELEEKMKHEYNRIILVQLFKQRKVLQELLNK